MGACSTKTSYEELEYETQEETQIDKLCAIFKKEFFRCNNKHVLSQLKKTPYFVIQLSTKFLQNNNFIYENETWCNGDITAEEILTMIIPDFKKHLYAEINIFIHRNPLGFLIKR